VAQTTGSETFHGVLVVSGAAGTRDLVSSVIVAHGVFTGLASSSSARACPGTPGTSIETISFSPDGVLHIVNETLDASFEINPRSCIGRFTAEQATTVEGGTGRFAGATYGRVWPNDWPNGQLHHDIARRCGAPVRIETVTGVSGGRASRSRRARRTRPAAAVDGVSLRVVDASLPRRMIAGSPRQPITWATSCSRRVPLTGRSVPRRAGGGALRAVPR
jgi:hypothetical protein